MAKKQVKLDDLCEFIIDCQHKTAPIENYDTGYYSIRTPDIGRGRLILENANRVSRETYEKWTIRAVPQEGDIILAREAPIGNVAVVPGKVKVCLGQRTVHIRPKPDKVHPQYLAYLMLGDEIQGKFHGHSAGATVAHLNMHDIRNLIMPELPPLPTQRKIAAILSAYDDLIENNTRRIHLLEQMAQALYREWFVKFRFPGHEAVRLVETQVGLAPQGWEVVRLGEVMQVNPDNIQNGSEPDEILYVNISSVSTGKIDFIEKMAYRAAPGRARRIVKNGDIIWSSVRPNRKSYSLIVQPPSNLIVSTGFSVLRATQVPFTYLYHVVTTDEFVAYLTNNATGSAYPAVNPSDFENAVILLPPLSLMTEFQRLVIDLYLLKNNLLQRNENLRRTRDLLLPRLVSGEVQVGEMVPCSEVPG